MGFDKDQPGPLVEPEKRTTKVNIWMALAILLFFLIAGLVVFRLWAHAPA